MFGGVPPAARDPSEIVTSLYLWGRDRDEVNRLASRAAEGLDAKFAWVQVSDSRVEESSTTTAGSAISAPAGEFAPASGISEQRMWTYLQPNGQRRDAQDLDRFSRMSQPIQQAIEHLLQRGGPRVLVIANLERLQGMFCKDDAVPHPFIEWLNAHEITLIATSTGALLHEGIFFDYSISQPDASATLTQPPMVAIRQRGDPDSSFLQRIFRPHDLVSVDGPTSAPEPASEMTAPT